jgi:hypothetical protein
MGTLTPLTTAIVIIVTITGIGAFIAYFRDRRKYRGYEELVGDAERLASLLGGESFRDGGDLVVSGNIENRPTYVRFSHAEMTPGLNIRMEAPANLKMVVAPRSAPQTEGRALVKTGDENFDARCVVRSDDPMQTKLFVGAPTVVGELQKLCCSARTYFVVAPGAMELSELSIPEMGAAKHIGDHIASMQRLIPTLQKQPGAERIKIKPVRRERRLVVKTAMLIGTIAALVGVIAATKSAKEVPVEIVGEALPNGVLPTDANRIGGINQWSIATESDYEGDGTGWLKTFGIKPDGHVQGKFSGDNRPEPDNGYLLVNSAGQKRVVIVANGQNRYDVKYPFIGLIARVPKAAYNRIEWVGRPPETPDGDGVLIVRKQQDHSSGLVIFFSNGRIATGVPKDYQTVSLLE